MQGGTLTFNTGGSFDGTNFNLANGGVINFSGGAYTFAGTINGTGDGRVNLNGATIAVTDGNPATFNFAGDILQWVSSTLSLPGGLTLKGKLTIPGGEKFL